MRNSPRRRRRWLVVIGLAVVLLLAAGFAVLRVKFEGPDLGDKVASILNKKMRGRVEIGSIEWDVGALKTVLTGGWVPLRMRHVRVWDDCALSIAGSAAATDEIRYGDPNEDCTPDDRPDPDPASRRKPRKLLLSTELITADIDIHALMFGNHDFVFRNVWVHGGETVIEQTDEPYPLHAYDRTIVSIVTAFYPRMKPGFRAGIYAAESPPIFDLRDIHLERLNVTVHMTPYSLKDPDKMGYVTTARLENVNVDADPDRLRNDSYLYLDPVDPLVSKFYVRLNVTAQRGLVRMWDEGPRTAFRMPYTGPAPKPEQYPPPGRDAKYAIALADIKLNRLAQLPTEWARKDFVANTLELDLEAHTLPCATDVERAPDPSRGAALHITGELHNYWDRPYDGSWNLALDAKNLGPTIRTCIDSDVGGDDLGGTITLTGPFVADPKIGLAMKNLDVDIPLRSDMDPLRLTLAEVQGSIDLVNEVGSIDKTTALIRGGKEPGEVLLSANFGLKPYNARAHVEITKAIDVGRFLPPRTASSIGRYLQGRLSAVGDTDVCEDCGFALEDFDLALGRTPSERALRVFNGRLFTNDDFDTIDIQNVQIQAGRSHASVVGKVDVLHERFDNVIIHGDFPDLDVWLARFGFPAYVKSAGGGTVILNGPLTQPRVRVATTLGGVPCLETVRVGNAEYQNDIIDITDMTTAGLGGRLSGTGRINVGAATPVIERLHLDGKKLDGTKLCGLAGKIKGTVDSVELDMAGSLAPKTSPMDWLDLVELELSATKLNVLGDAYSNVGLCVNKKNDKACRPRTYYLDDDDLQQCATAKADHRRGSFCAVATATRDGGGTLDATVAKLPAMRAGRQNIPARLGGTVAVSDLPISLLDSFVGGHLAGGLASATLHLQGPPSAPSADGAIQLLRSWVMGSFLGDAQLTVTPGMLGKVPALIVRGSALAGRLTITGTLGTEAPYPVEIAVSGRRIELDVLIDLQKRLGLSEPVSGWASGTVTMRTELAPKQPVDPEVWVELSELRATYMHRSPDGRFTPLVLNAMCRTAAQDPLASCAFDEEGNATDRIRMSLLATKKSIEFACKDPSAPGGRVPCGAKLATPAGVIVVKGYARENGMAIEARGTLELSQLKALVEQTFDDLSGQALFTASIKGTFKKPSYEAALVLDKVLARPTGGDTVLEIPSGLIMLANGSLGFTDVKVQVSSQHTDERGELHIKGNIALDGLTPTKWGLLIDGKIAGKMLLVAMPGAVSQASGLARIDGALVVQGSGTQPTVSGSIVFDQNQPLTIVPRGVHREVAFTQGRLDIDTELLGGGHRRLKFNLEDVGASINGEGTIGQINGRFSFRDDNLEQIAVSLNADAVGFDIPGTLNLVFSARNVRIAKASEASKLELGGALTIIDGKFSRSYALTDRITQIGVVTAPTKPFWEEYPTIGDANMDLSLAMNKFTVDAGIGQINLKGDSLRITGSPRDPRLDGTIDVQSGNFRIPGTRASFDRTTGNVQFSGDTQINPELHITSVSDYRDLSGQDHVITLSIDGRLDQLNWDLKTSTGYDKSQTLSLLVLGRNQEQLRRSLGDQTLGADPQKVDPTTNPSGSVADQLVKDLAGDWVSGLIGDSLQHLIGIDVLRIEIGFGSIGLSGEKTVHAFGVGVKVTGQTEQTIRGNTREVKGEVKSPWRAAPGLSVRAGYLNKQFNDPAEQDITDGSLRLAYRFFIP